MKFAKRTDPKKCSQQPKCPLMDKWIKKMWYKHIHAHTQECYPAIKNKILPSVTTWLDPEGIMLNEISQTERDKHLIISLTCVI